MFLIILTLKKIPYLLGYVTDQYKKQQMCEKAILENGGTLKSVPECYKNQDLCNKGIDNYSHALELVPECYKTQAVDTHLTTIKYFPECYRTQEMCNKAVHRCFLFDSIPDPYKTQEICDLTASYTLFNSILPW